MSVRFRSQAPFHFKPLTNLSGFSFFPFPSLFFSYPYALLQISKKVPAAGDPKDLALKPALVRIRDLGANQIISPLRIETAESL
jgi:hypothetical protein